VVATRDWAAIAHVRRPDGRGGRGNIHAGLDVAGHGTAQREVIRRVRVARDLPDLDAIDIRWIFRMVLAGRRATGFAAVLNIDAEDDALGRAFARRVRPIADAGKHDGVGRGTARFGAAQPIIRITQGTLRDWANKCSSHRIRATKAGAEQAIEVVRVEVTLRAILVMPDVLPLSSDAMVLRAEAGRASQ